MFKIIKKEMFISQKQKNKYGGGENPAEGTSILFHIFHLSRWQSHLHFAALATDIK